MFTKLARFAVNKSFDVCQIQIWTLELIGVYSVVRLAQGLLLQRLKLDEEVIADALAACSVEYASNSMEIHRQLSVAALDVVDRYLSNEDATSAIKSFDEAMEDLLGITFSGSPPPGNKMSIEGLHAH